jgi:anti-anti-sigma factor
VASAGALADRLADCHPTDSIVIDCAELRFIDSSGLRVLVYAEKQQAEAGGSLELVNVGDRVRRVLEITGLDYLVAESERG